MEGMEEKLEAILENPQLMQQIMQLAQSVNAPNPSQSREPPKKEEPPPKASLPDPDTGAGLDPAMLVKLAGIAGKSNIDSNQKALLRALTPYLSRDRVAKLEKAMRAAKIASMASAFLNSGGMKLLSGR
ncbi:MAG: hypothetical protein ACI4P4_00125 [Faecousia sp.]